MTVPPETPVVGVGAAQSETPRFAIGGLWKLFGPTAARLPKTPAELPPRDHWASIGLHAAVCDVTLDIRKGEVFVVMGLSGSGKSTLLRCLSGLLPPSYGSVLLDDEDIAHLPETQLRQIRRHKMGMVFQNYALLPTRTVLDNVALPLEVQGQAPRLREARARELIQLVGLGGRETAYPAELSGGQQQRVGIARSLAVDPEVWLLDEPFSALDPLIRREMQDELIRLQALVRKTVVFVTHDFDEAVRLADRIAIMRDGRLAQVGTPEEIVLRPASDYVAGFTRDVDRGKVVRAASLVTPGASLQMSGLRVPGSALIGEVAREILADGRPASVIGASGACLGVLTPDRLLGTLFPDRGAVGAAPLP